MPAAVAAWNRLTHITTAPLCHALTIIACKASGPRQLTIQVRGPVHIRVKAVVA